MQGEEIECVGGVEREGVESERERERAGESDINGERYYCEEEQVCLGDGWRVLMTGIDFLYMSLLYV